MFTSDLIFVWMMQQLYDESLSMHLCSSFFEIHILLVQSCDGPVSVLSQRVVDYLRAVNLPRHQTLRIDR